MAKLDHTSIDPNADLDDISLIIVDAEENQQLLLESYCWWQDNFVTDVPFVALIADPADRAAVLQAGAEDFLLLPLISSEVQKRLAVYLPDISASLNIWTEGLKRVSQGLPLNQVLNENLQDTVQYLQASSGWLCLFGTEENVQLLTTHSLTANFNVLREKAKDLLKKYRLDHASAVQLISAPNPDHPDHYVSIPLTSHHKLIGLLNLAFPNQSNLLLAEKQSLTAVGQELGALLKVLHTQNEAQVYATQSAFMVLIARTLSDRLDMPSILSFSLEQTLPLLNATSGYIWLLSANNRWLELASSLNTGGIDPPVTRRTKEQGLLGWVLKKGRSLKIDQSPLKHPRFDPRVDRMKTMKNCAMLAVPLRHREELIGVMTLYNKHGMPFSNADVILLESIANLIASAISNARLMQELRDYANQQRALYEMSQQIAAGLDLDATLNRVLLWIGRLLEAEIGLMWLVEEMEEKDGAPLPTLCLVAALGIELPTDYQHIFTLNESLMGQVIRTGRSVIVNNPKENVQFNLTLIKNIGLMPRNIIAAPMIYRGQIIGAISLYNKLGGDFTNDDLNLLATAIEMAAVKVGNARLHDQTVKLLKERERLHKQIIQSERLITVGRLTASISHEINNPMQTIWSLLVLCLEDLDNAQTLQHYLEMSIEEAQRIVQLMNRMRQIYRPHGDKPEELNINELLSEAIIIARKELRRHRVHIAYQINPNLPSITAIADQLHLVFLSLMLSLGDAIKTIGGGQIHLRSSAIQDGIQIEILTDKSPDSIENWRHIFAMNTLDAYVDVDEPNFSLAFCNEIIIAHGGAISIQQTDDQTICCIELPLSANNSLITQHDYQLLTAE